MKLNLFYLHYYHDGMLSFFQLKSYHVHVSEERDQKPPWNSIFIIWQTDSMPAAKATKIDHIKYLAQNILSVVNFAAKIGHG